MNGILSLTLGLLSLLAFAAALVVGFALLNNPYLDRTPALLQLVVFAGLAVVFRGLRSRIR